VLLASSTDGLPDTVFAQWNPTILLSFLLLEANIPPAGIGCGRHIRASVGSTVRILNEWYASFFFRGNLHSPAFHIPSILCTLISSPKVSGYPRVTRLSFEREKSALFPCWCFYQVRTTVYHAIHWASPPFKPEIFPQDHVHRYSECAGLSSTINADRRSPCCISVSPYPVSRSFVRDPCRENSKHEQRITMPIQTRSSLFGVHLEELMGYDGEKGGVPRVVKDCAQYLRHTGAPVNLSTEP